MTPHRNAAEPIRARIAVLTVSDTRTVDDDISGDLAVRLIEEAGHRVVDRAIVPDDPRAVRETIGSWLADEGCDGVVVTGGTGISERDRTYEAVSALLERRLDGFGELFRYLSFAEIGSAAMLSRAVGGIARGRVVFALPGAPAAVRLGLEKLVVPELAHLLRELAR